MRPSGWVFTRRRGSDFTVQVSPVSRRDGGDNEGGFHFHGAQGHHPRPLSYPQTSLKMQGSHRQKQEAIVGALRTAVQRQLELAVQAELHALSSDEAAFPL